MKARRAQAVLFCPFCRESFEGEDTCPEHELALVPFDELPPSDDAAEPSEPVAAYDLRYGRAWVLCAAVLFLVAPAFPFVSSVLDGEIRTLNGYQVALARALNVWIIPGVALALLNILARRRTVPSMRGARAAVLALSALVPASVGYTYWRIHEGARLSAERWMADVSVRPEWGLWVLLGGFVLSLVGAVRFGSTPSR